LSLEKNETKYAINKKLLREFLTPENIALEVKIILSPHKKLDSSANKNSFFSKNVIKKRFKNLFNHSNIKLSS